MENKIGRRTKFQQQIMDELERCGKTRYWLALQCGWRPDVIYPRLNGPTRHVYIEQMMEVLGLAVTREE